MIKVLSNTAWKKIALMQFVSLVALLATFAVSLVVSINGVDVTKYNETSSEPLGALTMEEFLAESQANLEKQKEVKRLFEENNYHYIEVMNVSRNFYGIFWIAIPLFMSIVGFRDVLQFLVPPILMVLFTDYLFFADIMVMSGALIGGLVLREMVIWYRRIYGNDQ